MIPSALLLLFAVAPPNDAAQKDPNEADSSSFGCAGPREHAPATSAPPIVPSKWLVPDEAEPLLDGTLWKRFALDRRAVPESWVERASSELAGAPCALTTVDVDADEVRMARLTGAGVLLVNGEPFVGDPERRGFGGVPIALRTGTNTLLVAGIRGSFELELWAPPTRTVLGEWDVEWPREISVLGSEVTFPVFNASTELLAGLHVHYGHAVLADGELAPVIDEWRDGQHVLPLGVLITGHWFFDGFAKDPQPIGHGSRVVFAVSVYGPGDRRADERRIEGRLPELYAPSSFPGRDASAARGGLLERIGRDDAFEGDLDFGPERDLGVLIVYGTRGTPEEAARLLARVRYDVERLWYETRLTPQAIRDVDLLALLEQEASGKPRPGWSMSPAPKHPWLLRHRVVLVGNEDTNAAWKQFVPEDCALRVRSGAVTGPGVELEGDDVSGWFLHRRADIPESGPVTVLCDTGARASMLGAWLSPLLRASHSGGFAFHDAEGLEVDAPRLLARGRFVAGGFELE